MEVCHTWDEFFASTSSKGKPPVPTIRDRWEREELEKLRKQRVGLLRELNQARAYSKKLEVKLALKYSLRLIYVLFAIAWAAGWPLIGWWL